MRRTSIVSLLAALAAAPSLAASTGAERLTERKLDRIATIRLPKSIKDEMLKGMRSDQRDRLAYTFGSTYLWASMGGITRYKQMLVVSLMAPDAPAASYREWPRVYSASLDDARVVHTSTVGQATTTVRAGIYEKGTERVRAHRFEYADPSRRLHIMWHAVADEMPLADGLALLPQMAASLKIVGDASSEFADMRDRPRREAAERARRLALAQRMLADAGYPALVPGKPVFKDGMYLEWMADPEPRFQLLVPLGRVRAASPNGGIPVIPSPPRGQNGAQLFWGAIGWRAWRDDAWEFSNNENSYLPFVGIAERLASAHTARGEVSYYYSATVRVEEEEDDMRLTSLRWFTDAIPDVQRMWREGQLVRGVTRIPQ